MPRSPISPETLCRPPTGVSMQSCTMHACHPQAMLSTLSLFSENSLALRVRDVALSCSAWLVLGEAEAPAGSCCWVAVRVEDDCERVGLVEDLPSA